MAVPGEYRRIGPHPSNVAGAVIMVEAPREGGGTHSVEARIQGTLSPQALDCAFGLLEDLAYKAAAGLAVAGHLEQAMTECPVDALAALYGDVDARPLVDPGGRLVFCDQGIDVGHSFLFPHCIILPSTTA